MILTKQQLQDIVDCQENFHNGCKEEQCSMAEYCIDADLLVAQTALTLLDMLKRLEFSNLTWEGAECYICGGKNEHEEGCELAALLKESEGEEG